MIKYLGEEMSVTVFNDAELDIFNCICTINFNSEK